MKKLIILFITVITSVSIFAQQKIETDKLNVREEFKYKGQDVDTILGDTIPDKAYVDAQISGTTWDVDSANKYIGEYETDSGLVRSANLTYYNRDSTNQYVIDSGLAKLTDRAWSSSGGVTSLLTPADRIDFGSGGLRNTSYTEWDLNNQGLDIVATSDWYTYYSLSEGYMEFYSEQVGASSHKANFILDPDNGGISRLYFATDGVDADQAIELTSESYNQYIRSPYNNAINIDIDTNNIVWQTRINGGAYIDKFEITPDTNYSYQVLKLPKLQFNDNTSMTTAPPTFSYVDAADQNLLFEIQGDTLYDNPLEELDSIIYVSEYPEGNDTTGDGSQLNPFHSLLKAINHFPTVMNNARAVIKLDSGNFDYGFDERVAISKKQFFGRTGQLLIWGTFDTLPKGSLVYTQRSGDPFIFDVSGGTLTTGEWQYGFFAPYIHVVSSNYHNDRNAVIINNGTDWIEVSNPSVFNGTFLVKSYTTLDVTEFFAGDDDAYIFQFNRPEGDPSVIFSDLIFTGYNIIEMSNSVAISRCYFKDASKRLRFFSSNHNPIRIDGIISMGGFDCRSESFIRGGYAYHPTLHALNINNSFSMTFHGVVVESPSVNLIRISGNGIINWQDVKLKGGTVFNLRGCANIQYTGNFEIDSCDYLMTNEADGGFNLSSGRGSTLNEVIYLNTGIFNPASLNNKLCDPSRNISIYYDGLYPELETNLEETLTDNTIDSIQVGDTTQNYKVTIDYNITRSTDLEQGTLILTRFAGVSDIQETSYGDAGLTFDIAIKNEGIYLEYTTTSTGSNATFKYNVKRIMNL